MHGKCVSDVWPQICISSSRVDALQQAASKAQWVEWRVDLLGEEPHPDLKRSKLLWTWRTNENSSSLIRTQALIKALDSYGLVDMQLESDSALVRSLRPLQASRVILSYHGVYQGLEALSQLLCQLRAYPHVYCWKIALDYSNSPLDQVIKSLNQLSQLDLRWRSKIIFIPMGERLAPWRILACQQLADFLFCAASSDRATAKGQLPIEHILALQDRGRSSCFMGLIGNPVKQSISHLSHNKLLRRLLIDGTYLKFHTQEADLIPLLEAAHQSGFKGFSVTVPYKPQAFKLACSWSSQAQRAQAANTLTWTAQGWHADNTDMRAFEDIFREIELNKEMRVLVIGAGGSCRAALAAASTFHPQLFLNNRTLERAQPLVQEFNLQLVASSELTCEFLHTIDLLIQTTTLGMVDSPWTDSPKADSSSGRETAPSERVDYPFALDDLSPRTYIIELVNGLPPGMKSATTTGGIATGDDVSCDDADRFYPTPLVCHARSNGNRIVDAELFFFRQAAYQFEVWLQQEASLLLNLLQQEE